MANKLSPAKPKPDKWALKQAGFSLHRSRYIRHRRENIPVEDIAKADRVAIAQVRHSIRLMDAYYDLSTEDELKVFTIDLLRRLQVKEEKALSEALGAMRLIQDKETGEILREEPDHEIRMKAEENLVKLREVVQPKGKGVGTQVNVGLGVNVTQSSSGMSGGKFESRLRELQQKREEFLLNPPEPEEPEAEYEEGDEELLTSEDEAQPLEVLDGDTSKTT